MSSKQRGMALPEQHTGAYRKKAIWIGLSFDMPKEGSATLRIGSLASHVEPDQCRFGELAP
ncbi:MAG: hypothetical protein ACRECP_12835 [Methylocella sp.]